METVNILFRLIVKIVTVEGVACRAHPHLDPVQGGSGIRGHVGLPPSPFSGLQYPIFVLEILLGAILAVYASIALSYALRYYKRSCHSTNYYTPDKPTQTHHNPLYIDHHEA